MRKLPKLILGAFLIFSALVASRTLASSITLGIGSVELGQGVLLVTNCDSTIYAQPTPISVDGTYYLSGIEFSGIDTASCDNREFSIKVYNSSTQVSFANSIDEISVRLFGGFFYSLTSGIRIYSGDGAGWFSVEIEGTPTLTSGNLKRITLQSSRAGAFDDCNVTPALDGSQKTFTFTAIGGCIFTAPDSVAGATFAVIGGGGGGGGGSAVASGYGGGGGGGGGGEVVTGTTNLVAGAKYLIEVGDGGLGGIGGNSASAWNGTAGFNGYSSAAFSTRAQFGFAGRGGGWNEDEDGINNSSCANRWTDGTGGIGGRSGNPLYIGGAKSCTNSGGAGGGGSSASGNIPNSATGASGGSGKSGITGTYGAGGSGGAGGNTSSPANISSATNFGDGGVGGTGASSGIGSTGGKGAPGAVILRYTP